MKNKFVILMLALLCLSCTGKNSKKDSSVAAEDVQNKPSAVSLEFWETFSAPEDGTNPRRTSVITSKMGEADKAVLAYYAADSDELNYGGLLDILMVIQDEGGGVVGCVTSEHEKKIVSKFLALPEVRSCFPDEVIFMWGNRPDEFFGNLYILYAIYDEHADGKAPLDGSVVKEARADYSQYGGGAEISITMNDEGSRKWADLTQANIGMNIAVVIDGCVYSAPRVRERIECGSSAITGDFNMEEAEELANRIKNGKKSMPAK